MISQIAAVFVTDYLPSHKNVLQFEHFLVSFIFLLVCVCLCVGAIFTRVLKCSIWKFWQSNVTLAPTSSFFCPPTHLPPCVRHKRQWFPSSIRFIEFLWEYSIKSFTSLAVCLSVYSIHTWGNNTFYSIWN